jgi:hypothetical protein
MNMKNWMKIVKKALSEIANVIETTKKDVI